MPNMTYLCKCIILGILKQKKSLYFYNNIFMYTHTKVRMESYKTYFVYFFLFLLYLV